MFFVMSTKQQTYDSLEAEVKEEGNPDVGNKILGSSETNLILSMISVDVPALLIPDPKLS